MWYTRYNNYILWKFNTKQPQSPTGQQHKHNQEITMPTKKNYSHLMSTEEFFTKWNNYRALAYKVVLSNINRYPLHTKPGYGTKEDVVSYICLEMHRLGVFARYNAERQDDETKYVGNQIKSILSHAWQDYCRIEKSVGYIHIDAQPHVVADELSNSVIDAIAHDLDNPASFAPFLVG